MNFRHQHSLIKFLVFPSWQYHENTAPFLAVRFAQRFGISNPSPRYVDTIAKAFRTGMYVDVPTDISFGTGKYGDMAAMIAAVLLDREARAFILDTDPMHGSVQEPLVRFVRLMKSMEFRKYKPFPRFHPKLAELIGEAPYALPDVFSFFLPEYQPEGNSHYMCACVFQPCLLILPHFVCRHNRGVRIRLS